jgi:hypothetical protein
VVVAPNPRRATRMSSDSAGHQDLVQEALSPTTASAPATTAASLRRAASTASGRGDTSRAICSQVPSKAGLDKCELLRSVDRVVEELVGFHGRPPHKIGSCAHGIYPLILAFIS